MQNNKVCRFLKRLIIRLDVFGVPMQVTMFNQAEYRTCIGTLLTLILVGFLAGKTISLLVEMATRKDFDYTLSELPDMNTPLYLKNFTMYVCPVDQKHLGKWTFGPFSNFNKGSSDPITSYECSLDKLDTKFNDVFKNCFCYDMDDHALSDSNSITNLTLSIGSITLNDETSPGSNDLCLFYSKSYIVVQDYYSPQRQKEQMHLIQSVNGKYVSIEFYAENIEIARENDIPFGFDIDNKQELADNITNIASVKIQTSKMESAKGLITIQFIHNGWMKKYTFNGFNSDKFFSTLGGYYEIWIWFFTLIGNFINSRLLKCDIKKKLHTKQEKTVLLELHNVKEKELLKMDLETIKQEQIPGVLEGNDEEKKDNSSLNKNSNDDIRNREVALRLKTLATRENMLMVRREVKKNFTFNAVKQFEKYLDMESIYNIIKEVKLLALLCLNQKTAHLFFNCKICEMDLDKLETDTNMTAMSTESNHIMDSYEGKIDIIQDAIIDHSKIKNEGTFKKIKNCFCNSCICKCRCKSNKTSS